MAWGIQGGVGRPETEMRPAPSANFRWRRGCGRLRVMTSFAKPYTDLSLDELYEILRVRAEVFVVGQRCFYLDPP